MEGRLTSIVAFEITVLSHNNAYLQLLFENRLGLLSHFIINGIALLSV